MKKIFFTISIFIVSILFYLPAPNHIETEYTTTTLIHSSSDLLKHQYGSGKNKVTYYTVHITGKFVIDTVSLSKKNTLSNIASKNKVSVAINADFASYRDSGIIVRNGSFQRYKPARHGFAIRKDNTSFVYNELETTSYDLLFQNVNNTFSFGPILVDNYKLYLFDETYFVDKGKSIHGLHPRTAICYISSTEYYFVVVDGRQPGYSAGMTLKQLSNLTKDLGCRSAYNLDGGGSSTLYYNGSIINRPSDGSQRLISDIIYVKF